MGLVTMFNAQSSKDSEERNLCDEPLELDGTLHTFIFNGHISNDHEVSPTLASEVVLGALFQFPGVFIPRNNSIVEGHFALKGG